MESAGQPWPPGYVLWIFAWGDANTKELILTNSPPADSSATARCDDPRAAEQWNPGMSSPRRVASCKRFLPKSSPQFERTLDSSGQDELQVQGNALLGVGWAPTLTGRLATPQLLRPYETNRRCAHIISCIYCKLLVYVMDVA